jgi:hypothetical protein
LRPMPGARQTGMLVRNPKRNELKPATAAVAVMRLRFNSELGSAEVVENSEISYPACK